MNKGEQLEHRLAKDWGFIFHARLNGDPRAQELFSWKIQKEILENAIDISLANPSSLTYHEKIEALTMIINLRKEERQLLKEYLKGRKPLIYLNTIKRNRNQTRSIARLGNEKKLMDNSL